MTKAISRAAVTAALAIGLASLAQAQDQNAAAQDAQTQETPVQQAPASQTPTQDADALEAQYKTCSRHFIPADKCTPDIYQQLQAKEDQPLDPETTAALQAAKEYQTKLKNPASMQVLTAYIVEKGSVKDYAVCLEVGGQNGFGGQTISRVVRFYNGRWFDDGGFFGALAEQSGGGVNRWDGVCTRGAFRPKFFPGIDVTEKVNQALKAEK